MAVAQTSDSNFKQRRQAIPLFAITGLDPVIHLSSKSLLRRWMPGAREQIGVGC